MITPVSVEKVNPQVSSRGRKAVRQRGHLSDEAPEACSEYGEDAEERRGPRRRADLRPQQKLARVIQADLPDEIRSTVVLATELVRDLRGRLREEPLATSVPGLDRLLGGGLPRGTIVELTGRGSGGRFATLLAAAKMMTDTGQPVALVDQGEQLDPQSATEVGIDLDRLLWLRPRSLPDSLAAAEMLIHTGFPMVALDLGLPPVIGRAPLAAWLRLARSTSAHHAVVLVGSPYHLSGCAATTVLTTSRGRGRWSGPVDGPRHLHGIDSRLEVIRRRGRRPHETARTSFTLIEATFEPTPDPENTTKEIRHAQAL